MATLGSAYAEIHADTRPFAKELNKQIKEHLRKFDAAAGKEGITIGATLGKGIGKGLDDQTDRSLLSWRQRFVDWAKNVGHDGGNEFAKAFHRMATGNFILFRVIGRLGERIGALFTTVRRVATETVKFAGSLLKANKAMLELGFEGIKSLLGFTNDFSRSLASAQSAGASLAGAIASLAASASSGAVGLAAMAAAAVLLTSVLAALAAILIVAAAPFSQLLNFALLIPAALSVLLGVIAPLVIALHGLGDALELVFEQDPEKLAKGLAKLSPVMRQLTTTLRTFVPLFRSIQQVVQENFLGPIIATIGPLLKRIGPILSNGLSAAAAAMGIFVADVLRLLQTPIFTRFINELFPSIARMIETLSPALIQLLMALATATLAALPTVELLIGKLSTFLTDFAKWIEETVADGRFQQFLDDAIASAGAIWDLIKALIGLFAALFAETDEGGRKFLDRITEAVNEFTKWLRSPDGKQALRDAVVLALAFAAAFSAALKIIRVIVSVLSDAIRKAYKLLELVGIIGGKQASIRARQGGLQIAPQYQGGGVVPHDQIAMVHKGEPILDPANSADRNRGILADAGMLDLLSQPSVTNVYVGNEKLTEYIDFRVQQYNRGNAKSMSYGPRGGL
jgi:hypothetical protein